MPDNDPPAPAAAIPVTKLDKDTRRQAIMFDLVASNILSLEAALSELNSKLLDVYKFGKKHGWDGIAIPDRDLSNIFNNAWIVVDRVHSIDQLIGASLIPVIPDGIVSQFKAQAAIATAMRNKMDHIHEQIENLASKTRKSAFPILGVITATVLTDECFINGELSKIECVALSHSEFHHKINLLPLPSQEDIFPIKSPIDHIRLHAFTEVLNISKAVSCAIGMTDVLKVRAETPPDNSRRFAVLYTLTYDSPLPGVKG